MGVAAMGGGYCGCGCGCGCAVVSMAVTVVVMGGCGGVVLALAVIYWVRYTIFYPVVYIVLIW